MKEGFVKFVFRTNKWLAISLLIANLVFTFFGIKDILEYGLDGNLVYFSILLLDVLVLIWLYFCYKNEK